MATVYHTLKSYTATASAEATGYEDGNLSLRSVRRSWRSTALSNGPFTISLDLDSAVAVAAILLWDTNVVTEWVKVEHSANNSDWTTLDADAAVTANTVGRRSCLIVAGVTKQYWKLTLTASSSYDSADYLEIGRLCVFGSTLTLPSEGWPLNIQTIHPQAAADWVNGRRAVVSTGEPFAELSFPSQYLITTEDPQAIVNAWRAGPVALDLGSRFGVYLVEDVSDTTQRDYDNVYTGSFQFTVREVV